MRARKLARWVGRLAGVAGFGAAVVLGGVATAHADGADGEPDTAKWEAEEPAEGESTDEGDSADQESPDTAKWETPDPEVVQTFTAKWE